MSSKSLEKLAMVLDLQGGVGNYLKSRDVVHSRLQGENTIPINIPSANSSFSSRETLAPSISTSKNPGLPSSQEVLNPPGLFPLGSNSSSGSTSHSKTSPRLFPPSSE